MKKTLHFTFATLAIFLLSAGILQAVPTYPVVVESPAYLYANTRNITITKVELTQTATILTLKTAVDANDMGQSISIESSVSLKSDKGVDYPLVKAEGLTLGEQFALPKDEGKIITLTFGPMPANTRYINFIEGKDDNSFKIWGLALVKGLFPAAPVKQIYDMKEQLIPSAISSGKAIVKGKIHNFIPSLFGDKLTFNFSQLGESDAVTESAPIAADGTFTAQLPVYFPQQVNCQLASFYVVPGKTTELNIDLQPTTQDNKVLVEYSGTLAALNKFVPQAGEHVNSMAMLMSIGKDMDGKTSSEAIDLVNKKFSLVLDTLNSLNISASAKKLSRLSVLSTYGLIRTNLPRYASLFQNLYSRDTTRTTPYKAPEFAAGSDTLNRIDGELATTPYFSYVTPNFYTSKLFTHPLAQEAAKVNDILAKVSGGYVPTDTDKKEYDSFTSPLYKSIILNTSAKTIAQAQEMEKEGNVFYMKYNDVPNDQLLAKMMEPYKGKPVLVDIWATWCGPCKAAMKTIEPVKEELAGKVTFFYLTGETSPKATWMKMIPGIKGVHCYVKGDQWNAILTSFESQGVPTYLLIDKEGKCVNKYVGYPGNDTIKAELEKLM